MAKKKKSEPVLSSGYRQTIIQLAQLMAKGTPALVAIDGMTCTGKTTYAEQLQVHFSVDVLHTDDLPGATINEKVASIQEAIVHWTRGEAHARKVCIVEGCYSLHPALSRYYDLRICMQCDEQVREQRLKEQGSGFYESYRKERLRQEEQFFLEYNILRNCKIVVDS